jgi:hypothetical protein
MSVDPRIIASLITEDPDTFSEAEYNRSGVPYYARSDTPAVRPRSVSGTPAFQDTTTTNVSIKAARQEAQRLMGVARTGDMVDMRVNIADNRPYNVGRDHAFFGPGTIVRISDYGVTLKPDNDATSVFGKPGKKMVMDWFQFVKLAEPID